MQHSINKSNIKLVVKYLLYHLRQKNFYPTSQPFDFLSVSFLELECPTFFHFLTVDIQQ
jgi:hypothetical protein